MKKLILTLALAAAAAVCANAQIIVSAGYQSVTDKMEVSNYSETANLNGFYVDGTYNFTIASGLGVQAGVGVDFTSKSETEGTSGLSETTKYTGIKLYVPVYLNYKYQLNSTLSLGAFAGPRFSYAIVDKYDVTANAGSISTSDSYSNLDDEDFNALGIYCDEGIFVEYAGKYRLNVGAFEQLNNQTKESDITIKSTGFKVGLSILF